MEDVQNIIQVGCHWRSISCSGQNAQKFTYSVKDDTRCGAFCYFLKTMEYLMLLLFHDCLVIIFNYFYYIRYKPPTFNLRLSVLCLPVFSFVVEMIFTVKNVVIFLLTKRAELSNYSTRCALYALRSLDEKGSLDSDKSKSSPQLCIAKGEVLGVFSNISARHNCSTVQRFRTALYIFYSNSNVCWCRRIFWSQVQRKFVISVNC